MALVGLCDCVCIDVKDVADRSGRVVGVRTSAISKHSLSDA